ncbi:hypothetical protein AB6A40_010356 [Gnathostoma spinigerum]|uniref:Cation efflux protein transmembrane domain-containing protein n=1 Tax=Gnathostoma spinigerum TaxID=75299 RepID=A0ABD6F2K7_9BILA
MKFLFRKSLLKKKTTLSFSGAVRSLLIASVFTILFIIAEFVGGYLANSLAVMTDAGHLLSDLTSFFISLLAISLAKRSPTKRMSYGFHRAEILGALLSIFLLWALTAILVYMAVMRIVHGDFEVDADVMLITAGIAFLFNIIVGVVLYLGKADHSHFGMSHSHTASHDKKDEKEISEVNCTSSHKPYKSKPRNSNINVRTALIHVVSDLFQSVGVIIAAFIMKFANWKLADPICTFVFSILVVVSIKFLRKADNTLMYFSK